MPKVSVILPMFNATAYLPAAISSILRQSFTDFELLIMDDGSTDGSVALAHDVAGKDRRVRIFERANRGLVATLNELISLADAAYIARMDADDISHAERLAKQTGHLQQYPATAVLGCWVQTFGQKSEVWHFRRWDNFSRNLMFFGVTVLCHPTWMVRREIYEKYQYDPEFKHIEDREWLCRVAAAERGVEFVALPEVLLEYRVHAASITGQFEPIQKQRTHDIVGNLLAAYNCKLSVSELNAFLAVCFAERVEDKEVGEIGELLDRVYGEIGATLADEYKVFREVWERFCHANRAGIGVMDRHLITPDFHFFDRRR